MGIGNFHIGIIGNLFSGKTTLMNALAAEPPRAELKALLDGAEMYSFTERVEQDSLTDRCLKLFYEDRVANVFATEVAFLHMRVLQQREIRHLMTRESKSGVIILEDRPFLDGPEVFVRRMIDAGASATRGMEQGQRVRVTHGPLEGVEGILVRDATSNRLVVSIELLNQSASLHINEDEVCPLGQDPYKLRLKI